VVMGGGMEGRVSMSLRPSVFSPSYTAVDPSLSKCEMIPLVVIWSMSSRPQHLHGVLG